MKLKDWLPHEFLTDFMDTRAAKLLEVEVIRAHGYDEANGGPWPGTHKNVHNWCELENGYAVGWNENPAIGWSFPVIKLRR